MNGPPDGRTVGSHHGLLGCVYKKGQMTLPLGDGAVLKGNKTMTKYVVEPAALPNTPDRPKLKTALQSLTNLVEEFAKAHPGKVKILSGAWINTTLSIETDQQTADELSCQRGIGKVDKARPLKREHGRRKPGSKQTDLRNKPARRITDSVSAAVVGHKDAAPRR